MGEGERECVARWEGRCRAFRLLHLGLCVSTYFIVQFGLCRSLFYPVLEVRRAGESKNERRVHRATCSSKERFERGSQSQEEYN